MSAVAKLEDLIDGAKKTLDLRSDQALSRHLNFNEKYIAGVRRGKINPSEDVIVTLADYADLDPAYALLDLRARTATSKRAREVYEKAKKFARHGFLGMALTILPLQAANNALNYEIRYDNIDCAIKMRAATKAKLADCAGAPFTSPKTPRASAWRSWRG